MNIFLGLLSLIFFMIGFLMGASSIDNTSEGKLIKIVTQDAKSFQMQHALQKVAQAMESPVGESIHHGQDSLANASSSWKKSEEKYAGMPIILHILKLMQNQ